MTGGSVRTGGTVIPLICAEAGLKGQAVRAHTVAGQCALAAADEDIIGVLVEDVALGEVASIGYGGLFDVLSGAAITAGDDLKIDAGGDWITWVTAGERAGQALRAAGGAAELIEAWVD